jgi:calpain-15
MENAIKKKYVMTAGTASSDDPEIERNGLSPSHAYTLMNIYSVKTSSGSEKLVKLRNPWGNNEYSGDWSHLSKKWTPQIKKICEYSGENDDGIFYMSYKDFIKYFIFLDIAKLEPGYKTTFCKIKKKEAK